MMTKQFDFIDIDSLSSNFSYLVLERRDDATNAKRYYAIGWQETLYGMAIVRVCGRLGHSKRRLSPIYHDSLDEAWPDIKRLIERRFKRGYVVVSDVSELEPVLRVSFCWPPSPVVPMEQLELIEEK